MANPFKPTDKVRTKLKGTEVEATVRAVWNDEVQVRTPDGVLRWRTVKTVWAIAATEAVAPAAPQHSSTTPGKNVPAAVELHSEGVTPNPQPEPVSPAAVPEVTTGAAKAHTTATPALMHDASMVTPCGVESVVKPHRNKRRRK